MDKSKMPGVGLGVMLINNDGKVLLILRNSDAKLADSNMHLEGTWTLPANDPRYILPVPESVTSFNPMPEYER